MSYEFNDDEMTDRLDYLYDRHADFFEWLEDLFNMPENILPEHWEDFVTEPSDEELSAMNAYANLLVQDIMENNDENSHGN